MSTAVILIVLVLLTAIAVFATLYYRRNNYVFKGFDLKQWDTIESADIREDLIDSFMSDSRNLELPLYFMDGPKLFAKTDNVQFTIGSDGYNSKTDNIPSVRFVRQSQNELYKYNHFEKGHKKPGQTSYLWVHSDGGRYIKSIKIRFFGFTGEMMFYMGDETIKRVIGPGESYSDNNKKYVIGNNLAQPVNFVGVVFDKPIQLIDFEVYLI